MTHIPRKTIAYLIVAALAPAWLAVYSLIQLDEKLTWQWMIDAAAFCALYMTVFVMAPKKKWLRITFALIVAGWFVFFHVGNVAYYKFYDTWAHIHIFDQWKDSFALGKSVSELLGLWDWLFGVLAPLLIAIASSLINVDPKRKILAPVFLISAFALVIVHYISVGSPVGTKHQEPMMYFIRAPIDARVDAYRKRKGIERVAANLDRYYPIDHAIYQRSQNANPPFASEPVSGTQAPKDSVNIVIIMMESVVASASGAWGASPSYTPNLDALAANGLMAKNFYANGSQTVRGELASLCSYYPNLSGGPIYSRYHKTEMICLPEILGSFGYQTMWISSYKKTYNKKSRFLRRHGVDEIYDIKDMPPGYQKIGWGPADENLFESAATRLDAATEPFFAEIMTLSNHHPFHWDYPSNATAPRGGHSEPYENFMRGIFYTDYAIGKFFESVRDSEWFARTIFVIVGDHGIWLFPEDSAKGPVEKQEAYFRVPMVIYAPDLLEAQVFEQVASQVDIAPTVMDIIGARAPNTFVGQSLLAPSGTPPFAVMLHDRQWNIRRGNEYCYDVGEQCFYEHIPRCPKGYKKDLGQPVSCFHFEDDLLSHSEKWRQKPLIKKNLGLMSFAEDLTAYHHRLLLRK